MIRQNPEEIWYRYARHFAPIQKHEEEICRKFFLAWYKSKVKQDLDLMLADEIAFDRDCDSGADQT